MTTNNKIIITVKDVVSGTSTNAEGFALYTVMNKAISNDKTIVLSLKACTALSSSFLNSSIGAIVEKHGLKEMKGKLIITDYTPVMADNIKKYMSTLKKVLN